MRPASGAWQCRRPLGAAERRCSTWLGRSRRWPPTRPPPPACSRSIPRSGRSRPSPPSARPTSRPVTCRASRPVGRFRSSGPPSRMQAATSAACRPRSNGRATGCCSRERRCSSPGLVTVGWRKFWRGLTIGRRSCSPTCQSAIRPPFGCGTTSCILSSRPTTPPSSLTGSRSARPTSSNLQVAMPWRSSGMVSIGAVRRSPPRPPARSSCSFPTRRPSPTSGRPGAGRSPRDSLCRGGSAGSPRRPSPARRSASGRRRQSMPAVANGRRSSPR